MTEQEQCEHGYAGARCVRAGRSWTAERTKEGRKEFREHLKDVHRVDQVRPGRRYR